MLRRISILSVCVVLAMVSAVWARPGTVYVKNPNKTWHGEITVHDATVDVAAGGITTTFQKADVAQIIYDEDVPNLIDERFAKLGPTDVQGRIDLGQFAMDFKRYDDARKILTDAQKIDPGNSRVSNMLATIDELTRPAQTAPATPGTPGTPTNPGQSGITGNPAAPTTSSAPTDLREVTPDEINTIRLAEWEEDQLKVHVRVDADARKQFVAETGTNAADFVKLTPVQQAWLIYTKGDKTLASGIHMLNDPPALLQYRQVIQRQVISGCAASACHGGAKPGNFKLFPGESDAAVYTDFLILNKFGLTVDGKMYPMISREQPQESLLLSEMLTAELATVPHPKVDGYHGMCKTKADPKYVAALGRIRDVLNPVRPTFDIDLTRPPPKKQ